MKSIIISDIHLGVDDKYAENVKNRPLLIAFLEKIWKEKLADEVVINGDFLDQWFLPGDYKTTADSDAFYKEVAKNNQEVIDAFANLMQQGIKLVYVPGNHDMTLSHKTLNDILPGINQARDVRGLGRYRTGERGEIVIEHSHRYEMFCAPDPLSNKEFVTYGEPILPAGYFFARIGVTSLVQKMPQYRIKQPQETNIQSMDEEKLAEYAYSKIWNDIVLDMFPIKEDYNDKFIKVDVDGFRGEFSVNDVMPKEHEDGIYANLYKNVQKRWDEIQRRNLVPNPSSILFHLKHLIDQETRIQLSKNQYFDLDPTIDVVVFGHTHLPAYREFEGYDKKKIFVNEGTWIDNNTDDPANTCTFALIESSEEQTKVDLLKCIDNSGNPSFVEVQNDYIQK